MEALSLLGCYYADKLEAAVYLKLGRMTGNASLKSEATAKLTQAAIYWKQYSAKSTGMYRPQLLTRLCGVVDVQRFDRLAELDILSASE
jgi:hypothetical protein